MSKIFWELCICILIGNVSAIAQNIRKIGIEQGLSNNSVTCITQDSYGFIWMGTYDGLNRFNGYEFTTYRNIWGNPQSLINNKVKAIDAIGDRLYVGTEKGFTYLDYTTGRFHRLYFEQKYRQYLPIDFNINQIAGDSKGNLYAATGKHGLLRFAGKDSVGERIKLQQAGTDFDAHCMVIDKYKHLWVWVQGVGLAFLNQYSNEINIVNKDIPTANCLAIDRNGIIWIGTSNGLFTYQPNSRSLRRFDNDQHKLSATNVSHILISTTGDVWVATNGGGITIWHAAQGQCSYILPGEGPEMLYSAAVTNVFEDNENRKWIATLRGGVGIIDNHNIPFRAYDNYSFHSNSVENNFIRSFCEDEKHNLWIGTDGGGVSYWNPKTNAYKNYAHNAGSGSLSSNYVVSIVKDHQNKIWMATFNGAIDVFEPASGSFKHYSCKKEPGPGEEKNFWKLLEDSKHRLWACTTWGGALYLYDRKNDRFNVFDPNLIDVHSLYEDQNGNLWGGNYTQLIKIDIKDKHHQRYFIGQPVRAITEDNDRHLWIGTEGGGLLQYDNNTHHFKRYTEADGLPNNSVINILVDDRNRLWCSTYNGLSEFDPLTKRFVNYFASDGLQSNQFLYNAALRLSSGKMIFGGIKGFNIFNPDSVRPYIHVPRLQFTDLKINNLDAVTQTTYTDHQALGTLKSIVVPFDQATISIGFTALEYSYPEKIKYAYYLDGWDHGWNYVNGARTANYSRLNEGNYTLHVRSTNTEGIWKGNELTLHITVLPPWFRTWWAYALYLLIMIVLIYSFWTYRKRQIKLKYEVAIANNKINEERLLNEQKLSFFTNVSHEFRTPLTLIINPIKDLLNRGTANKDELNVIYRNARRLLGLVDHLLMFRKAESENAEMHISQINFTQLAQDVFNCFLHQAKIKNISYQLIKPQERVIIYGDSDKLEISLFNLISNAIKFTPEGGHIEVQIEDSFDKILLSIADNGIGISHDIGNKLFGKFYQVKEKNYFKNGFGIGLYLVKKFIESHHGSISYHDNSDAGTTFVMALPKGKVHFAGQPVAEMQENAATYSNQLIDHDNADVIFEDERTDLELLISDKQSLLIVDDNDQIRTYIRRVFMPEYAVYEAVDANAALELTKKLLPDLIISDIVMNGMSGLDLCKIVKQDSTISHIPVILLTGDATPDIMLQSIHEGAADFLRKPFEKDLLVARVKSLLKSKKDLQNYFYNEVTLKSNTRNISEQHKDFIYKAIGIIEDHLTDSKLDVEMLAKSLSMSYPTLFKRIKAITGQSVNNFIRFIRLRKAAELLIQTNCNVNEAAYQVGLNDLKYFREHFNKQFGVNPSEFIKKHRSNFQISYNLQRDVTSV